MEYAEMLEAYEIKNSKMEEENKKLNAKVRELEEYAKIMGRISY